VTQLFVAEYFGQQQSRGEPRWLAYLEQLKELYRRRRDVMLAALREHFPAEATWTEPEGGLFIWATLPDYLDTSDLLAKALRADVAFVPGQGAYVDGRGGSSMRLNFSGVNEDEIREGIRRIGIVIAEQVDLYEALASPPGTPVSSPGMPGSEAEDVPVDGTQPSPGSDHSLIPSEPGEGRLGEDKGAGGEDQGTAAAGQAPDSDAQGADVLPFRQAGEA